MKIRTQNSIGTGYYTVGDIRSFFIQLKEINLTKSYKHTIDELNEIETSIHRATNTMIEAYESILSTLEPNSKSYEQLEMELRYKIIKKWKQKYFGVILVVFKIA